MLKDQIRPHAKYWDCYNDEPLEYDHTNRLAEIAENFAINFCNWVEEKDFIRENSGYWANMQELNSKRYSTKELLSLYQQKIALNNYQQQMEKEVHQNRNNLNL